MRIKSQSPAEALRPFVKSFTIVESDHESENRILPTTSVVLAFRLNGILTRNDGDIGALLPSSAITGIRKRALVVRYATGAATLLVEFAEQGPTAFFDIPMHELYGQVVSLEDLIERSALEEVEEEIAASPIDELRIATVERFLLARLRRHQADRLVSDAVQMIRSARGNLRMRDLAGHIPISRDPFEKRFRRAIGSTPKQFATIVRLSGLIDRVPHEKNLTTAALDAGYFDQAHFTREFKIFAGQTPREYFAQVRRR